MPELGPKRVKTGEVSIYQNGTDFGSDSQNVNNGSQRRQAISKDDDTLMLDMQGRLDLDFNSDDELDKVLIDRSIRLDASD